MGSGGVFFDYDNDGWVDVFLVDGGSVADPKVAPSRVIGCTGIAGRDVHRRVRTGRHPSPRLRHGRVCG